MVIVVVRERVDVAARWIEAVVSEKDEDMRLIDEHSYERLSCK